MNEIRHARAHSHLYKIKQIDKQTDFLLFYLELSSPIGCALIREEEANYLSNFQLDLVRNIFIYLAVFAHLLHFSISYKMQSILPSWVL